MRFMSVCPLLISTASDPQNPHTSPYLFVCWWKNTREFNLWGVCRRFSHDMAQCQMAVYELEMENTGSRWGVSASMFSANFNCLCLDFSIFFPLCLRPVCTCAKNNKISSLASEFPWKI